MTDKKNWILKFLDKKRVRVTPRHYRRNVKVTFIIISLLLLGFFFGISIKSGDKIVIFASALLSFLLILSLIYFTITYFKSIALKGDSILIKSLLNKNMVTSVRSITNVKSRQIVGLTFTMLRFNLDGKSNCIYLVNRTKSLLFMPDVLLRRALQEYKK